MTLPNQVKILPPKAYIHVLLPTDMTDAEREQTMNKALQSFAQRFGSPPTDVFLYRISYRPVITDHLVLGPAE